MKHFRFCKNLKKILVSKEYDVVHSNMEFYNGIVTKVAKKAGVKTRVAHAHNSNSQTMTNASFIKKIVFVGYKKIMRWFIFSNATNLCACSEQAIDYEYGKKKKKMAHVIYNGIELEKFKNAEYSEEYLSNQFGVKENNYHILTVGRVANQKNPWFMIDIIEQLAKIRRDFDFVWVGLNVYLEHFQKAIKEKGIEEQICFAGVRSDIPQIMKNSDIFILPSLFEGLGIVLIEAQAAGLHCIASDKCPELVDCGNLEFLEIEGEGAAQQWAERISTLLDLSKKHFDSENIQKFDIMNTINQLSQIYEV